MNLSSFWNSRPFLVCTSFRVMRFRPFWGIHSSLHCRRRDEFKPRVVARYILALKWASECMPSNVVGFLFSFYSHHYSRSHKTIGIGVINGRVFQLKCLAYVIMKLRRIHPPKKSEARVHGMCVASMLMNCDVKSPEVFVAIHFVVGNKEIVRLLIHHCTWSARCTVASLYSWISVMRIILAIC